MYISDYRCQNLGELYLKTASSPNSVYFTLNWHWVRENELRSSGVRIFKDIPTAWEEDEA